jgi:hypothetical protein
MASFQRLCALLLLLPVLVSAAACGKAVAATAAAPTSQNAPPPKIAPGEISGTEMTVYVYLFDRSQKIDIAGLDVDLNCVKKYTWDSSIEQFREAILRQGCARIVGSTPSKNEQDAEQAAKNNGAGVWKPAAPTTTNASTTNAASTEPSKPSEFVKWLGANAVALVSALFAFLAIPALYRFARRARNRKRVEVVLFGAGGAGKTDLWIAWAEGNAALSEGKPSKYGAIQKRVVNPIPLGPYTLMPTLTDGFGGDPAGMLNSMQAPGRHKKIMLIVLGPHGQPGRTDPAIDPAFVQEQIGYLAFPRALIGDKTGRIKPDLVALVFTKFDLLAAKPAGDSSSEEVKNDYLSTFQKVTYAIQSECRNNAVHFVKIVVSAKHGWGVDDLQQRVTRLIFTGQER